HVRRSALAFEHLPGLRPGSGRVEVLVGRCRRENHMGKRQLAAGRVKDVAEGDRVTARRTSVHAYQDAAKPERSDYAGGNRRGFVCASACPGNGAVGHNNLLLKTPTA